MTTASHSPVRRAILVLTVGSFSIAALLGVAALLTGGSFGEAEGKVLLTTLIVGSASVCVLCYLATGDTPYRLLGALGGAVVLVPTVASLLIVWADWDDVFPSEGLWKTFGVGTVWALTLAQACMLLGLAWSNARVRWVLWPTLVLAVVLAVIVSGMILGEADDDGLLRLTGVVAILDVLGTVVTVAVAKFGQSTVPPRDEQVELPVELQARLAERAALLGRSRSSLLAEAVESYLAEPPMPGVTASLTNPPMP